MNATDYKKTPVSDNAYSPLQSLSHYLSTKVVIPATIAGTMLFGGGINTARGEEAPEKPAATEVEARGEEVVPVERVIIEKEEDKDKDLEGKVAGETTTPTPKSFSLTDYLHKGDHEQKAATKAYLEENVGGIQEYLLKKEDTDKTDAFDLVEPSYFAQAKETINKEHAAKVKEINKQYQNPLERLFTRKAKENNYTKAQRNADLEKAREARRDKLAKLEAFQEEWEYTQRGETFENLYTSHGSSLDGLLAKNKYALIDGDERIADLDTWESDVKKVIEHDYKGARLVKGADKKKLKEIRDARRELVDLTVRYERDERTEARKGLQVLDEFEDLIAISGDFTGYDTNYDKFKEFEERIQEEIDLNESKKERANLRGEKARLRSLWNAKLRKEARVHPDHELLFDAALGTLDDPNTPHAEYTASYSAWKAAKPKLLQAAENARAARFEEINNTETGFAKRKAKAEARRDYLRAKGDLARVEKLVPKETAAEKEARKKADLESMVDGGYFKEHATVYTMGKFRPLKAKPTSVERAKQNWKNGIWNNAKNAVDTLAWNGVDYAVQSTDDKGKKTTVIVKNAGNSLPEMIGRIGDRVLDVSSRDHYLRTFGRGLKGIFHDAPKYARAKKQDNETREQKKARRKETRRIAWNGVRDVAAPVGDAFKTANVFANTGGHLATAAIETADTIHGGVLGNFKPLNYVSNGVTNTAKTLTGIAATNVPSGNHWSGTNTDGNRVNTIWRDAKTAVLGNPKGADGVRPKNTQVNDAYESVTGGNEVITDPVKVKEALPGAVRSTYTQNQGAALANILARLGASYGVGLGIDHAVGSDGAAAAGGKVKIDGTFGPGVGN